MINNIIFSFFCAVQMGQFAPNFQRVCLFNEKLCLEVPNDWIRQENYSKFSDYEVIYDTRCISKDSGSQVTVKITDKKYNPKKVGVMTRLQAERQSDSLRWRNFVLLNSGIAMQGPHEIGFLKYEFLLRGKKRYMIESLFSDKDGNLYTIEIFSLVVPSEKFKETAQHIYRSLKLN